MILGPKRKHFRSGETLVMVILSLTIILIAVLGASSYRYHATLDTKKAAFTTNSARIALLLCESWRGVNGVETYDPCMYLGPDVTITENTGPSKPGDFTLMGSYEVVSDDAKYYATLSWKDISSGLRAINVVVAWSSNGLAESVNDTDKTFTVTNYTLN